MLFGVMSTFYSASLWGQSDGDPWVYGPPQNDTCHFNSIDVSTKVRLKTKDLVYFKFREATGSNFHFTSNGYEVFPEFCQLSPTELVMVHDVLTHHKINIGTINLL